MLQLRPGTSCADFRVKTGQSIERASLLHGLLCLIFCWSNALTIHEGFWEKAHIPPTMGTPNLHGECQHWLFIITFASRGRISGRRCHLCARSSFTRRGTRPVASGTAQARLALPRATGPAHWPRHTRCQWWGGNFVAQTHLQPGRLSHCHSVPGSGGTFPTPLFRCPRGRLVLCPARRNPRHPIAHPS